MELYLAECETPWGVFLLLFHRQGIYEIFFPGDAPEREYPRESLPWPGLEADLGRCFREEKVTWEGYRLDMGGYPPFTFRLLEAIRKLPYGAVCSYRDAARMAGSPRAWRAAGQALAANRHPLVVPCHRVIRSDGSIGGFGGPPGWKEALLKLEGVKL